MNVSIPVDSSWLFVFIPLSLLHIYFITFYSLSFFGGGSAKSPIKVKFWKTWGEAEHYEGSGKYSDRSRGYATIHPGSAFALYQMFLNFLGAFVGWLCLALILFKSPAIGGDNMQIFFGILSIIGISGFMPNLLSRTTSLKP